MANETALKLLGNELMHAGVDQQRLDGIQLLEQHRITAQTELPPMQFLFRLFGKPCFPRGELVALSGKPKAGKTFDEYFYAFNMRRLSWQDRLPLLMLAMEEYKPDLVIVDGIRDFVDDINDGKLSQKVLETLMGMASRQNCCIVNVLHQNKGVEDKNLRGWIGTELTHKAFEVYECRKDASRVFSFSQRLTRKYDITSTLCYVVDDHGFPQQADAEQILDCNNKPYDDPASRPQLNPKYHVGWDGKSPLFDLGLLFADALPDDCTLYAAKEMQERVMRLSGITSVHYYEGQLRKAQSQGLVIKTADEFGHVMYYRQGKGMGKQQAAAVQPTPAVPGDAQPEFDFSSPPPGEAPF